KALRREPTTRPPVWMMRQAGRFLPEYRLLREKYTFFERCQNPELACEITLQPVKRLGVDAAILFSDILVVPQAMGMHIDIIESKGPIFQNTIQTLQDIENLLNADVYESLGYIMKAIQTTKQALNNEIPLLGFAGTPWTLFCYMVEGRGSRNFQVAKTFCYTYPKLAHQLLEKITTITINYLIAQAKAGVNTVQLFDSYAGLLSAVDYEYFSLKYIKKIIDEVQKKVPVILYTKGIASIWTQLPDSGAQAIGVDWTISPEYAVRHAKGKVALQGNFDPVKLFMPIPEIKKATKEMIDAFGTVGYIANLGHGILPNVPVEHAQAFVDTVKEYQKIS
ncbi:MAG: uroporphyrinogen decarboxylase, partial [Chitinophagaceae bacterium]